VVELGARPVDQSKLKDESDLLIAATDSVKTLPSLLRVLANAGTSPRLIKVHPPHGVEQLIETRGDPLEQPALESIARRLTALPAAIAVAYRMQVTLAPGWWARLVQIAISPPGSSMCFRADWCSTRPDNGVRARPPLWPVT
jgi:hypothetical protein